MCFFTKLTVMGHEDLPIRRTNKVEASHQDRERDSGCIPGFDTAQRDAAGVNGSNRI